MLDKKRQEELDALRRDGWTPGPTAQSAIEMERELLGDPGNIRLRCELLECYARVHDDKEAVDRHLKHVCWLIDDHSTVEPLRVVAPHDSYGTQEIAEVRKHIREQLTRSPMSAELHGYAAKFLAESDEDRIAHIRDAQQIAPNEFWYSRELVGLFYKRAKNAGANRRELTALAIVEADKALKLEGPRGELIGIYVDLMPLALENAQIEKAEQYARSLLELVDSMPYDWYKQTAQLILARAALARKDPNNAKELLVSILDSFSKSSSSARLHLAGSNRFMDLLDELLQFGEDACVLDALQFSAPFCTADKRSLMNKWIDELKSGQTPKLRFAEPH